MLLTAFITDCFNLEKFPTMEWKQIPACLDSREMFKAAELVSHL